MLFRLLMAGTKVAKVGLAAGCAKPFGTEAVDGEEKFTSSCYVGNFLGHIGRDYHDADIIEDLNMR